MTIVSIQFGPGGISVERDFEVVPRVAISSISPVTTNIFSIC